MAKIFLFFIILFLIFIGILTSDKDFKFVNCSDSKNICFYNGRNIDLSGYIVSDVENDDVKSEFIFRVESGELYPKESKRVEKGNNNILVSANFKEELFYGDFISLKCNLQRPTNSKDSKFDYVRYLELKKIYSICKKPILISKGLSNRKDLYFYLFKFKEILMNKINVLYKNPYNSFVAGILFGYKGLDKDISVLFSNSGISHIIAISGYNIAIIVSMLSSLFLFFGINRFRSFYLIVFIIFLFNIFTGAGSSVVRASIMGCLSMFSLQFGRKSNVINLLFFVGFIMVLFNPFILLYDIGFQLSFLATFGILTLNPILDGLFSKIGDFLRVKESLFTTVSAFIMTSSIIFINFGKFSFLPILINILALPTVSFIMLFGFLSVIFSFIPFLYFISKIFSFLATFLMEYIILVCKMFY